MPVISLSADRADDVTAVLAAAFRDYPVLRFVLGESADYDERLAALGEDAHHRYEAFGAAAGRFPVSAPHHHLNMIGVRPAAQGQGHGRRLLEAVHALAAADPGSAGVSLTTELPANVALYRRFGYEVLGETRVTPTLTTWACYRPHARD